MAVSTPSIEGLEIKGTFNPSIVTGFAQPGALDVPFTFAGLTYVKSVFGAYTPANDIFTVKSWTTADKPAFFLFLCDQISNVALNGTAQPLVQWTPVNRMLMMTIADLSTAPNKVLNFSLDGRTAVSSILPPMAQGVAVNYLLAWSDGIAAQT